MIRGRQSYVPHKSRSILQLLHKTTAHININMKIQSILYFISAAFIVLNAASSTALSVEAGEDYHPCMDPVYEEFFAIFVQHQKMYNNLHTCSSSLPLATFTKNAMTHTFQGTVRTTTMPLGRGGTGR